ncbi:Regulatory protein TenI [compost metagenome]
MYELHVISDGIMPLAQFAEIAARIQPFVTAIHIRERQRTAIEIWNGVQQLLSNGIPPEKITVNDRLDIAWACGIGSAHLATHSIPLQPLVRLSHGLRIGRSVHTMEEARESATAGADYLFFGHVYDSESKRGLKPRGLRQLHEVTAAVPIPVIAIGGIGLDQIDEVLDYGAQGIAVISSILHAVNPVKAAQQMAEKLNERR